MRPIQAIFLVLLTLGAVCLSVLLPSQLGPLADPREKISDPSPVWFLIPLSIIAQVMPWWAAPLVFGVGLIATGSVAWVLGGRSKASVEPATVDESSHSL